MPIRVVCRCGQELTVPDQHAGRRVRCWACQGIAVVPGGAPTTVTMRPAPAPPPPRPADPLPVVLEPERRHHQRPAMPAVPAPVPAPAVQVVVNQAPPGGDVAPSPGKEPAGVASVVVALAALVVTLGFRESAVGQALAAIGTTLAALGLTAALVIYVFYGRVRPVEAKALVVGLVLNVLALYLAGRMAGPGK